jgi:hypothetical protein
VCADAAGAADDEEACTTEVESHGRLNDWCKLPSLNFGFQTFCATMLRSGSYIMSGNNIIYRDGDAHKVPFFCPKKGSTSFLSLFSFEVTYLDRNSTFLSYFVRSDHYQCLD